MNTAALSEQLALLPDYLGHHLLLSLAALGLGIVICLPVALAITRVKALQWPVLTFAGVMQTIPGIALLALMVPLLGMIGFVPALLALFLYSLLPIMRNTVTGILGVDPALTEAARGIGMTSRQSLFRVELPLAAPVIIAGIRTATVWVVGTATLSTLVGATSLGNYIFSGLQTQNFTSVLVGCVAAALLATVLDLLIRLVEIAFERRSRRLGILAAALLFAVLGGGLYPYLARAGIDREKPVVVIGSKTFTEQYILADLFSATLIDAGYAVETKPGMGSMILFDALTQGTIDCYVDYTGTIWANVMKRDDVRPADTVLAEMTRWLADTYGVVCLGALGFENTYALAVTRAQSEALGLFGIADLAAHAPEMSLGSDYEFFARPEWVSLRDRYGLEFRDLLSLDATLMYGAVAQGDVDVITAFSTDGRIVDYDLVILDDPRNAFPPYDAVLLLSPQAAARAPLVHELQALLGAIDDATMREANRLVDLERRPVGEAARWLRRRLGTAKP